MLDPRISTIFNMGFELEQNNGQIVLLFNCNGYCYFSFAMVTVTFQLQWLLLLPSLELHSDGKLKLMESKRLAEGN